MKRPAHTSIKAPFIALSLLMLSSSLCPAFAQSDNSAAMQRIDRLDHDLQIIQRQLARGEVTPGSGGDGTGSAQLEVRLSAIEDELRNMRGKAEENDFQIKRLSDNMDKMQRDVDMRFSDLNNKPAAAPAADTKATAPATDTKAVAAAKTAMDDEKSSLDKETPADSAAKTADTGSFATPREHYNYAFHLLNETKYKEAAESFEDFTKKYPKDALIGNAYYWQGETYYIRRDYVNAADMFRQGFEAMPDGPKAADNLLKLAMSLNALKRDKEACVVLEQISTKFVKSSKNVADRAVSEQKRIGCKR